MDLFNGALIPFFCMFGLSLTTVISIRNSRSRIHTKINQQQNSTTNSKDRKFAITSIAMNISFLLLILPSSIYAFFGLFSFSSFSDDFTDSSYLIRYILILIYFTYSSICFYVQFFVNSVFRNHFLKIVNLKNKKRHNTNAHTPSAINVPRTNLNYTCDSRF